MPQFFLPDVTDEAEAERAYEAIVRFNNSFGHISRKRFFSIRYTHKGREHCDEVGKPHSTLGDVVVAILHVVSNPGLYLVCLPSRGIVRDQPFLVSEGPTTIAQEFMAD